jgi:hypothetical protein
MAVKTFYLNDVTAPGSSAGSLQDGGVVSSGTTGTGFQQAFSTVASDVRQVHGIGNDVEVAALTEPSSAPAGSAQDSWRADALSGTYAAGVWSFAVNISDVGASGDASSGRIAWRLWKSPNANGSGATELTSGIQRTTAFAVGGAQTTDCTGSVSLGSITLTGEYLFLELAATFAGDGVTGAPVVVALGVGTAVSFLTTPDFTPAGGGGGGTTTGPLGYFDPQLVPKAWFDAPSATDRARFDSALADAASGSPVSVGGQLPATSALSGAAHGQASAGGQLSAVSAISGKAAAQGRGGGQLSASSTLSGKAVGQARSGGQLIGVSALSGKAAAQGRAGGQLVAASILSGAARGQAAAAAQLPATSTLSGRAAAQARAGGQLPAASTLSATASGQAQADGHLVGVSTLSGFARGQARAGGQLSATSTLSGTAAGQARAGGELAAVSDISATAAGQSRTGGQLPATSALSGSFEDGVHVPGHLTAASTLSGSAQGEAKVGGVLSAQSALSGAARGAAQADGQLSAASTVSAAARGAAATGGQFDAISTLSGAASVPTPVTVGGQFDAASMLSGQASVAQEAKDRADGFVLRGTRLVRVRPTKNEQQKPKKQRPTAATVKVLPLTATSAFGGKAMGAASTSGGALGARAQLAKCSVTTLHNPTVEEMGLALLLLAAA